MIKHTDNWAVLVVYLSNPLGAQVSLALVHSVIFQHPEYIGDGVKTLVPRVIGQTAEAERRTAGYRKNAKQWSAETFYPELFATNSQVEVDVAQKIEAWAHALDMEFYWGFGTRYGSFSPRFWHKGEKYQLFAVYTYGAVETYFQWYKMKPPFDDRETRLKLLGKLNAIPGVSIEEDGIDRRPSIPLAVLAEGENLTAFFAAYEWFVAEVKGN